VTKIVLVARFRCRLLNLITIRRFDFIRYFAALKQRTSCSYYCDGPVYNDIGLHKPQIESICQNRVVYGTASSAVKNIESRELCTVLKSPSGAIHLARCPAQRAPSFNIRTRYYNIIEICVLVNFSKPRENTEYRGEMQSPYSISTPRFKTATTQKSYFRE